jgi:hypothetical protein
MSFFPPPPPQIASESATLHFVFNEIISTDIPPHPRSASAPPSTHTTGVQTRSNPFIIPGTERRAAWFSRMCWGHERESTSFYTFLSVIKTITSRSRISRLKSCFMYREGEFQFYRSHLLSHTINTAAQGDSVYSDGPVLMLRWTYCLQLYVFWDSENRIIR